MVVNTKLTQYVMHSAQRVSQCITLPGATRIAEWRGNSEVSALVPPCPTFREWQSRGLIVTKASDVMLLGAEMARRPERICNLALSVQKSIQVYVVMPATAPENPDHLPTAVSVLDKSAVASSTWTPRPETQAKEV